MTIEELENFVFNWMLKDIEREIEFTKSGYGGGNVLCALGLMSYTEFMGRLLPTNNQKNNRETFNDFFRILGPKYKSLLDEEKIDIYGIFRCGLVHEYFIKGDCTIAMLNSTPGEIEVKDGLKSNNKLNNETSSMIKKPVDCGIIIAENGNFLFNIERYFDDFKNACEELFIRLKSIKEWKPPCSFSEFSDTC